VIEVPERPGDNFHVELTNQVLKDHKKRCTQIFEDAQLMQFEFQNLTKLYAEPDPKVVTLEDFFGSIFKFLELFDKSRREVIERRKKEEKKVRTLFFFFFLLLFF
jgi:hypothetical protein